MASVRKPKRDQSHLPLSFWQAPESASTTLTRSELQETLLYHEGWLTACGAMWDIKARSLGAGVHKVWLVRRG